VPQIGTTLHLTVGNTAAPLRALGVGVSATVWGSFALPLELTSLGASGCFVHSSWDVALDAPGGTVAIPVPLEPALGGTVAYAQWGLFGDPNGPPVVTTASTRLLLIGR